LACSSIWETQEEGQAALAIGVVLGDV